MKLPNISYKYKLLALALFIIIFLTATILVTVSNYFENMLKKSLFRSESQNMENNCRYLASWMEQRRRDLENYADSHILRAAPWTEKIKYLKQEVASDTDQYYFFFISDIKGNYSTTLIEDAGNIRDRKYFSQIMAGTKTTISGPLISRSTGRPMFVVGAPLKNTNNRKIGMLGAVVRLGHLSKFINKYNNPEDKGYSFIINDTGKIIAHPRREYILQKNIKNINLQFSDWKENIIDKKAGHFVSENNYIFHHNLLSNKDWKLINVVPKSYLQRKLEKLHTIVLFTGLFSTLIFFFITLYIIHNISRPIEKLKNTFQKGAQGNLNVRAQIETNDELGQAADSFNKMMDVINDLTFNDPLTGLPNLQIFKDRLERVIENAKNTGIPIYVASLGINNFKSIIDRFGQTAGDQLLKKVAVEITKDVPQTQIARMGDEFYFFLVGKNDPFDQKSRELLANTSKRYNIEGDLVYVTAQMGVTIYPSDNKNVDELVKNAGLAMHAATVNEKIRYFSKNIEKDLSQRKKLETDLHNALDQEQFVVHYQPIVKTETGKTVGLEALIRWEHPEQGLLSPVHFLPLAEETGFITEIDHWMLAKATRDLQEIQQNSDDDIFVSVNIDPQQFYQEGFPQIIEKILAKNNVNPSLLEIELTERTAMRDIELALELLQKLKNIGVRISLDDFGTGYSSLNYLTEFDLNTLKIDKSFIGNFLKDSDSSKIVNTIINIGHNLDLKVIAEGVETEEQHRSLNKLNCDMLQGYHFSKPLPLSRIVKYMKADNNIYG